MDITPIDKIQVLPDGRMDTRNSAAYLGYSPKTMAMMRCDGTGPQFIKKGRVFYFKEDLDTWVNDKIKSTKIHRDDPEALSMIDQATQKGDGAPLGNANAAKKEEIKITFNNIQGCLPAKKQTMAPTGNSRDTILRRLRKDHPDLHSQVIAKELSAHAAGIKAGFLKPKFQVEYNVESAARILLKKFNHSEIEKIWEILGYAIR